MHYLPSHHNSTYEQCQAESLSSRIDAKAAGAVTGKELYACRGEETRRLTSGLWS